MSSENKKRLEDKAIELHHAGWTRKAISEKVGYSVRTVYTWLKKNGVLDKQEDYVKPSSNNPDADAIDDDYENMTKEAVAVAALKEEDKKIEKMFRVAEKETDPLAKSLSYIQAKILKLLNDSNVAPPKNIKEQSILVGDYTKLATLRTQVLNGSGSNVKIDLSILTNKKSKAKIIDVEPNE